MGVVCMNKIYKSIICGFIISLCIFIFIFIIVFSLFIFYNKFGWFGFLLTAFSLLWISLTFIYYVSKYHDGL